MIESFQSEHVAAPSVNGASAAPAGHDTPSVEALLFAAGAITADQLGELVRDAVLTQRPAAALAVERGFATQGTLDALLAGSNGGNPAQGELGAARHPAPVEPSAVDPTLTAAVVAAAQPVVSDASHGAPAVLLGETANGALPMPTPAAPAEPASVLAPQIEAVTALPTIATAPRLVPSDVEETVRAAALAAQPAPPVQLERTSPEGRPAFAVLMRLQSGEQVAFETAATFEAAVERARAVAETVTSAAEWPFVSGRLIRPEAVVSIDIERALEA